MTFKLNDQYSTELKINDVPFPITGSTFESIYLIENVVMLLPSIHMTLRDPTGIFSDKFFIGDGSKISLTISRTENEESKAIEYLIKGSPLTKPGRGMMVNKVYGTINKPKYLYEVPKKSIIGTSSEAIQKIASACDMEFEVDPTNDSMTWLPTQKPYGQWAHKIADHGWIDDTGCTTLAVNENGKLLYKNIDKVIQQEPKFKLTTNEIEDTIMVSEYKIQNRSIELNSLLGYGAKIVQDKFTGDLVENNKNEFTRLSSNLEMSEETKEKITHTRVITLPFDVGNTHKNYSKAFHQNRRVRALYAIDIRILIQKFSGVGLYDVVSLEIIDPVTHEVNTAFSAKYVVTAKTRIISGSRYSEMLTLTTQGRETSKVGQK
jgi:hypothetical protein